MKDASYTVFYLTFGQHGDVVEENGLTITSVAALFQAPELLVLTVKLEAKS